MTPRHPSSRSPACRPAGGYTLIEVLVAVLVLSLGILGAAGMQATSLRANREARMQEIGTRLAAELAELVRANHILARKTDAATNPYLVSFTSSAPPSTTLTCFTAAGCAAPEDIARRDVAEWAQRAALLLPGLRATVCYDAAPFDGTGQPEWSCDGTGDVMQIKIGWARSDLNRSNTTTLDAATKPAVVLSVKPMRNYS